MECFGTNFTHAQSCDNVRVESAREWTAAVHTLHMPEPVITFMFNTYLTHVQTCDNVHVQCATEWTASVPTLHIAQSCDSVRVRFAREWIASVHILHMPKAVITFVLNVLRNGLFRYILHTCPKL